MPSMQGMVHAAPVLVGARSAQHTTLLSQCMPPGCMHGELLQVTHPLASTNPQHLQIQPIPAPSAKYHVLHMSCTPHRMEGPPRGSGGGLPHVSGGMKEKFDAARRGAMLMSTLGSAGLEKMLAKVRPD